METNKIIRFGVHTGLIIFIIVQMSKLIHLAVELGNKFKIKDMDQKDLLFLFFILLCWYCVSFMLMDEGKEGLLYVLSVIYTVAGNAMCVVISFLALHLKQGMFYNAFRVTYKKFIDLLNAFGKSMTTGLIVFCIFIIICIVFNIVAKGNRTRVAYAPIIAGIQLVVVFLTMFILAFIIGSASIVIILVYAIPQWIAGTVAVCWIEGSFKVDNIEDTVGGGISMKKALILFGVLCVITLILFITGKLTSWSDITGIMYSNDYASMNDELDTSTGSSSTYMIMMTYFIGVIVSIICEKFVYTNEHEDSYFTQVLNKANSGLMALVLQTLFVGAIAAVLYKVINNNDELTKYVDKLWSGDNEPAIYTILDSYAEKHLPTSVYNVVFVIMILALVLFLLILVGIIVSLKSVAVTGITYCMVYYIVSCFIYNLFFYDNTNVFVSAIYMFLLNYFFLNNLTSALLDRTYDVE